MYFSGRETPYPCLEIMYKKQNSCAKILTFKVHPPVIGAFLLVRMLLDTSLHLPECHQNVVIASSARRDESFSSWRVPPSGFGESDFLIGLRSSFVTLRHDNDLIVEPYIPHRFIHQYGFCQVVPGVLLEQHYDGSLLALVQLWDSCVRLGSSSKIIIPMHPSNEGPLMTRPRKDDVPSSTKSDQRQLNVQGKSSHSSKSKATLNNPSQKAKATSKSNFDGKDTQVEKKVRYPSLTLKAVATSSEAINISHKSKDPSRSSDKSVEESPSVVSLFMDKTKASISPNEVGITSATSSSNESNISQEQHWKRLKKKPKDLDDQNNEFVYLDSISIDTAIFGDSAAGSTMPLTKYAQQLGLGDISCDIFGDDMFEDCITSSNPSNTVKSSHPSLDNIKSSTKAGVNKIKCPNVSKNVICSLQHIDSTFEPQEGFEKSMSSTLLHWRFCLNFFFKKYGDYDVVRSSSSQKMNRDSHQELLSAAQRLHTAIEEKFKMNKRLGELQIVLAKTEKKLEVLTTKKKKTTSFIDEHQKKLSRNQESITSTKDEIHTIEETSPLSEDWFKPFP
ncbi:hypothetical protein RND71_035356 [Anisodus tanguticus]|uniref:Uncharacterized protein n=1 Tax=Anisodus tanguticus TaxID=243964 RepID=A0AAE1R4R6_9SOLA|nr:hypothetical protein RND71_035356 [Anisodus tanguticus]